MEQEEQLGKIDEMEKLIPYQELVVNSAVKIKPLTTQKWNSDQS